ncbi:MAG: hypothetical protein Q9197_002200 [Variospora fuerteventurae]
MLPVANNTAPECDSIWKGLDEKTFRSTIAALSLASNGVPGDSRIYAVDEWKRQRHLDDTSQRRLSLKDEQRLADDLAYIAVSRDGAKAVSAVALEENFYRPTLTVRLAANGYIPEQVPKELNAFLKVSESSCVSSTFAIVIRLNRQRIHGRLRSKHWIPAKDKLRGGVREAPLHKSLHSLLPELRRDHRTRQYYDELASLCETYRKVDECSADHDEECHRLDSVIQASFDFCQSLSTDTRDAVASFSTRKIPSSSTPLQSKHVKQIEKIGRYRDLCIFATKATSRYPELFRNLKLAQLNPYSRTRILDQFKKESVNYYVHAEIQLLTFYDLTPSLEAQAPRVLGVSKSACYLCNLFISLHGKYFISKTHGRLYHQWTVPNLAALNTTQRRQYRTILQKMHGLCKAATPKSSTLRRLCPPESTYDFCAFGILSPIAASTASMSSQKTIRAPPLSSPLVQDFESNRSMAIDHTVAIPSADSVTAAVPGVPGSPSDPPSEVCYEPTRIGEEKSASVLPTHHVGIQIPTTSTLLATNVDPANLLLRRTITDLKPFHIEIPGMHICFETEDNKPGRITLRKNSTVPNGAIDVDAMAPGDMVDFYGEDETFPVHLDLYRTAGHSISLDLEWLPD